MVFTWRFPTVKGCWRGRIKTHAAFGVGIWVRTGVILLNRRQICDFLNTAQSGRFAGFFREGNGQSEPDARLFYLRESIGIARMDDAVTFCKKRT
jgi:hypothetical protein